MERMLLTLIIAFTFQIGNVEARLRPLGKFYKLVPESQAHVMQGSAFERDLDPSSIKVFVWNIKKAEMMTWKQEFKSYGEDKDLYLIQEAYETPLFVNTLKEFSNVRWDMGISFLYKIYNNQATGNMIGSDVEPTEVIVKHTPDMEPVIETPKTTTFAKYPVEGSDKNLLAISVHGINLTSFGSFKRHMNQIEEVIAKHDGPVVFAGDFNTRTKCRTVFLEEMMKRLKFNTITFKNGEYRMKFKFTPYYLDHGFVRGLQVKKAEVIKESSGSDHKPMTLELALLP